MSDNSVDDGDVLSAVCCWMPPDFAITHDWRRGCQTSNVREIPIIPMTIEELFKVVVGSLAEVERVQLSSRLANVLQEARNRQQTGQQRNGVIQRFANSESVFKPHAGIVISIFRRQ
ncbi:hypothetical protein [Metapseudomonas otitidis]|uniref:hypothetical protein n=1 Tax=Metapseudomonas otitidis TaxID=319939 RepID=UPI002627AABE|nr:hypothetical protein [Pseudomonas otitidis]